MGLWVFRYVAEVLFLCEYVGGLCNAHNIANEKLSSYKMYKVLAMAGSCWTHFIFGLDPFKVTIAVLLDFIFWHVFKENNSYNVFLCYSAGLGNNYFSFSSIYDWFYNSMNAHSPQNE